MMGANYTESIKDKPNRVDAEPQKTLHNFRNITAIIHPEGDDARVTIHTTAGPINLSVGLEYIGRANTEIRRAAILMAYRATMKKDEGETALSELLHTALRPDEVSVVLDKRTGDRLWVLQFDGHSPIVIRLTPEQGDKAYADLQSVLKSTAN